MIFLKNNDIPFGGKNVKGNSRALQEKAVSTVMKGKVKEDEGVF